MTAVIVRGSANVRAGAHSRLSAVFHGVWLLVATFALAEALRIIPLAVLAAILVDVGYHLCGPTKIVATLRGPVRDALPFAATFIGILVSDILIGAAAGLATHGLVRAYDHMRRKRVSTRSDAERSSLPPREVSDSP
jgi:MFS superfamily sulfate permease-like transporter